MPEYARNVSQLIGIKSEGIKMNKPTDERFWGKVNKISSGCWLWIGSKNNMGYGWFWDGTKNVTAHRYSLMLHGIPMPLGLECDHTCHNRACVNPSHIELVPHIVNIQRGINMGQANKAKTHCPLGHPYSLENTLVGHNGYRYCRTCRHRQNKIYRDALKSKYCEEK
jgi:hypothetical protein